MIPGHFPFSSHTPERLSQFLGSNPSIFNAALLGSTAASLPGLSTGHLTQPHIQALIQGPLRGIQLGLALPLFAASQASANSGIGVGQLSNNLPFSSGNLNSIVYYPTSVGQAINSQSLASDPSTLDSPTHTIVRAPVLYKSDNNLDSINNISRGTLKSTEPEQSPPDRVVASYAAAAHATALACHQPISKAAEVYLAATSNVRSRHSKRTRNQSTINHSTSQLSRLDNTTTTNESNAMSTSLPTKSVDLSSERQRRGWTRIVDRKANAVTYISQEGVRLHNIDEVFGYFAAFNPDFLNNQKYKDLIASCFVFSPTTDSPSFEDGLSLLGALYPSNNLDGVSNQLLSIPYYQEKIPTFQKADEIFTDNNISHNTDSTSTCSDPNSSVSKASSVCRISFNPNCSAAWNNRLAKRVKLTINPPTNASIEEVTTSVSTPDVSKDPHQICSMSSPTNQSPVVVSSGNDLKNPSTLIDTDINTNDSLLVQSRSTDVELGSKLQEVSKNVQATSDSAAVINLTSVDSAPFSEQTASSNISDSTVVLINTLSETSCETDQIGRKKALDDSMATMNTETLTTGARFGSKLSCSVDVVPSVLSPVKQHDQTNPCMNLLALNGIIPEQSVINTASFSSLQNAANPLLVGELISARVAQLQQQHLANLLCGLSAQAASAHSYPINSGNPLLGTHPLNPTNIPLNPWVPSLSEIPITTPINNCLNPATVQQQILAAALQQQQQAQAVALATLLQRQQPTFELQNYQQQCLASQTQNYLAALQQFMHPS